MNIDMNETHHSSLPEDLNLDFPKLVTPALDMPAEMQEHDMSHDMDGPRHSSPPDELNLELPELEPPAIDAAAETGEQDINHDLQDAWYCNLQDQLHEDLQEMSGIGEILADQQTQDGDDAVVPEPTADSAVPATDPDV